MGTPVLSFVAAAVLLAVGGVPSGICKAQDSLFIGAKGMYLWQLWTANGGGKNLNTVITNLNRVGAKWVVIKMADGDSYYNSPNHSLYNWVVPNYGSMDSVIAVLHSQGIKLLAFQYVYGAPNHWGNAVSETNVADMILDVKGIDGLLIDAEIEYDTLAYRVAAARGYCDSLRAHHPHALIGLTAWARIAGHATFPWTTFLDRVDVNMPQTYWAARPTSPQNELSIMNSQFTSSTNIWVSQGDSAAAKPIMPIGQGEYFGYSSDVLPGDISSFCSLSQTTFRYPGISLWEYNQIAHQYVWDEYTAAWTPTSVSTAEEPPIRYSLVQNYPNPFNPGTVIGYTVAGVGSAMVQLVVYDVLGREVANLVDEKRDPGNYAVSWNAAAMASGVYFYRMQIRPVRPGIGGDAGNGAVTFTQTRKMILMK